MPPDPSPDAGTRGWAVPVVGVLLVVVAASVVFGGLFVFGTSTGCACQPPATHASTSIDDPENESTVTVTFTSNNNAAYLLVRTEASNGSVTVADTTGDANTTDEGVRLATIGDAVTYAPADTTTNTTVDITVVAFPPENGDASPTDVADETISL